MSNRKKRSGAAGRNNTSQELSSGPLHAVRVLKELCTLRHLEALCDGVVQLTDGSVKVNKAVLASGCPYFRTMYEFEGGVQQLSRTTDPSLDITRATFELILDFIYTGKVMVNNSNIEDILKASDLLLMSDLKNLCAQYLLSKIDADNCLGMLQFAQQFSCPRLVHHANDFICNNFKYRQIVNSEEFHNLSEKRVKELLSMDALSVKSEVDILSALVTWINANLTLNPDVKSLVSTCLRRSSNYDPEFQRALQDLRASAPPWDSVGAKRIREALRDTQRIRFIRGRGKMTALACSNSKGVIYLVDVFGYGKFPGSHVVMPHLLLPRIQPALISEGGYLYVLGGRKLGRRIMTNDVQRFDPSTGTWSLMSPMPYSCCSPHVTSRAGKIYITGGFQDEEELDIANLEEYDIYTNTWRSLPPVPKVRHGAALASTDTKIFYIGGSVTPVKESPKQDNMQHRTMGTVNVFYIQEEIWTVGPQLKTKRSHATACSRNGVVYVVGGSKPTDDPNAQEAERVQKLETEILLENGWLEDPRYAVPHLARFNTTAVCDDFSRHMLIVGKSSTSNCISCFSKEGNTWTVPLGGNNILKLGSRKFLTFSLFSLPAAALVEMD